MVVGAGRGIGAAVVAALAEHGARVGVIDIDAARGRAVVADVARAGGAACFAQADVLVEESLGAAFEELDERLGSPRVLVNVAGGMRDHARWRPADEWSTDDWARITALNLTYVLWSCRAVLPAMRLAGEGAIVNVASVSGLTGAPSHAAYGAAKAGLISLTRTLALENGPYGVRVNAVAPGTIDTPAVGRGRTEELAQRMAASVPLQRRGTAAEIASAALFLASPWASYVTGQTLVVDGGASVKFPIFLPEGHPGTVM